MKKLFIGLLLSLSCACAVTAVGCSEKATDLPKDGKYTVDFTEAEGWDFISDTKDGASVDYGTKINFSVDVSVFYTGSPVVWVNDTPIAPASDGTYAVEVKENVTIKVEGVRKDVSNMVGSGAFDDAFLVTKPIDLLYIAQQVNAGNYAYVTGSYILANDIDCGGEELEIIGDYATENAYFAGCFTCQTDAETGDYTPATISNFVINSNASNNVGLFGAVMVMPSVTSSGLFYGINLDNFTINASITDPIDEANRSIFCGSLIGYGVGARTYLCNVTNGTINLYADEAYFSFTGGMFGYQQGLYDTSYGFFPSEVAYSEVSVDINAIQGVTLYAGGISGYLATNSPASAAYVDNSYATGNITGAIRAGGIAGGLGQYTSVSNCYATGEVVAKASQIVSELSEESLEYCYANAGGIVGHAENDTIVNDCFFAGKAYASAKAGKAYASAKPIIGGGYEATYSSAVSQKYVEWNNYPSKEGETVTLDKMVDITTTLGWNEINWIIENGKCPEINREPSETIVRSTITRHYVVKDENGEWTGIEYNKATSSTMQYHDSSEDSYAAISEAFYADGGLPAYYTADDKVHLSYGYFLDEACTIKLPLAYVPMKSITLYVAFADPTAILGDYVVMANNTAQPLSLRLTKEGRAFYTDGETEDECQFLYDGETLVIELSRFARYYDGAIEVDSTDSTTDAYFDMNRYGYYDFKGVFDGDVLKLYDGNYFTANNPLIAAKDLFRGEYYTNDGAQYKFYGAHGVAEGGNIGYAEFTYTYNSANKALDVTYHNGTNKTLRLSDLKEYDAFKGVWTKSATVNKSFIFDGMGNWWYEYSGFARNGYYQVEEIVLERMGGAYTVSGDTMKLDNGYTVRFNSDGLLEVKGDNKTQIYGRGHSYIGTWTNNSLGLTLQLDGVGQSGVGAATLLYDDGSVYNMDYEATNTNGYVGLHAERIMQAYFYYDRLYNAIVLTMYDGTTGTNATYTLYAVDDYEGEWISNTPAFENIEFNGEGLYGNFDYMNMGGSIRVNDEEVPVKYTLVNSTLNGTFTYNGVLYTLEYDEDTKSVTIYGDSEKILLERKDIFANQTYVDMHGNEFDFDGKSNLTKGGTFTHDDKTYGYKANGNAYDVTDGGKTVGKIVLKDNYYQLSLNGNTHDLYIKNELMGKWAISGEFILFEIGPTDANGNIKATFKGYDVTLSYVNPTMLTFNYKDESGYPYTYYVFILDLEEEDSFAISENADLFSGYQICNRADDLFGTWTSNRDSKLSISFDGVQSDYANGVAKISRNGNDTMYYYNVKENGILMWSQELLNGNTLYYKIEFTDDLDNKSAYRNGDKAILRTEVDAMYLTEAKDKNGVTYVFDGGNVGDNLGTLTASNGKTYSYKITAFNTNNTANVTLIDKETNQEYTAVLDYSDGQNITLTITEMDDNIEAV